MTIRKLICLCLSFAFIFAGCSSTSTNYKPFEANSSIEATTDTERRLWAASEKLDKAIKKSGQIFKHEPLRAYLQDIMDKLYPEFKGKIKVQLLKDPILNAFALPNGSIYVNTGLIAAMENEAQLAAVLAHEGIHFTQKHGAKQRENFHNTFGASLVVSLLGVPYLAQLVTLSSIFGYSKEHEMEADTLGHKRLVKAGYDYKEAPKTFEHLLLEVKANKIKQPFFFSTHPALEKRIENFTELNKTINASNTKRGTQKYNHHVYTLREKVLREKIKSGQYNSVIAVLTHEKLKAIYPDLSPFYLGEAYRLRGEKDDRKKAMETYLALKESNPDYPPVYKSLGMIYYKNKIFSKATFHFEKYLALNPGCKDAGFIKHYLKNARGKQDIVQKNNDQTNNNEVTQ